MVSEVAEEANHLMAFVVEKDGERRLNDRIMDRMKEEKKRTERY